VANILAKATVATTSPLPVPTPEVALLVWLALVVLLSVALPL
jgi:hypothetical protein